MAVYERKYGAFEGVPTPEWARFLVLPRYSSHDVFRSKLFLVFYSVAALLFPFALSLLIYLPHNLKFLETINASAGDILSFFRYDASFFFEWFMGPALFNAFIVAFIIGPALISADLRNNGLPLYLARPFSRTEYILGKTTVLVILLSGVTWVPGMLLFVLQAYLGGTDWLAENARVGFGIFVGSWIWILVLCLLSLALSAYVKWKPMARIALIGVFFVASAFGEILNGMLRTEWGSLIQISQMLEVVWASLFGIDPPVAVPAFAAWISLLTLCAACLLLLSRKVRAYEVVR